MKAAIGQMHSEYAFSARRACRLLELAPASYRYHGRRDDAAVRERLERLARERLRFGYRRLGVLLRREGLAVNHKRLHRVYREAGLALRRHKRKHCRQERQPLTARTAPNQEWALDFVHDAVASGRHIRVLTVVDAYTRECLALEVQQFQTSCSPAGQSACGLSLRKAAFNFPEAPYTKSGTALDTSFSGLRLTRVLESAACLRRFAVTTARR